MFIVIIVCIMSIFYLVMKNQKLRQYIKNFFVQNKENIVEIEDKELNEIKNIEDIEEKSKLSTVSKVEKPVFKDQFGKTLYEDRAESNIESALFNVEESKDEVKILDGARFQKPKITNDGFHRLNKFENEDDSIFNK